MSAVSVRMVLRVDDKRTYSDYITTQICLLYKNHTHIYNSLVMHNYSPKAWNQRSELTNVKLLKTNKHSEAYIKAQL